MENKLENLYGVIFTYNPFSGNWRCCKREDYLRLFSENEEKFVRSKEIEHLRDLIIKHPEKLEL